MRGAEAVITIENDAVMKERVPKGYRHPVLDEQLRTRRTKAEHKLLQKAAAAGVNVPSAEKIGNATLRMTRVEGPLVKDVLDEQPALAREIGTALATLHDAHIIHGDVTTSNMIAAEGITFIDFGLGYVSRRLEDKAVDIHLFKQALESRHHAVRDRAFSLFVEGYKKSEHATSVLERLQQVESRGKNKK